MLVTHQNIYSWGQNLCTCLEARAKPGTQPRMWMWIQKRWVFQMFHSLLKHHHHMEKKQWCMRFYTHITFLVLKGPPHNNNKKIHLDDNKNPSSLKRFSSSKVQDSKYLLRFKAICKLWAHVKSKKNFILSLCRVKVNHSTSKRTRTAIRKDWAKARVNISKATQNSATPCQASGDCAITRWAPSALNSPALCNWHGFSLQVTLLVACNFSC